MEESVELRGNKNDTHRMGSNLSDLILFQGERLDTAHPALES